MASTDKTPIFVGGIGPPLSQIREDYEGERTTYARDVLALVAEVERLRHVEQAALAYVRAMTAQYEPRNVEAHRRLWIDLRTALADAGESVG